eukprot:1985483-Prymnesium_polylepis.1
MRAMARLLFERQRTRTPGMPPDTQELGAKVVVRAAHVAYEEAIAAERARLAARKSVSYTHLTLPTICSV